MIRAATWSPGVPGLRSVKPHAQGTQVTHGMVMLQWQDGQKVIIWPEELAPGQPGLPTPPWNQRP